MTGIEDVINALLFRQPKWSPSAGSSVERLGNGEFHVDYHDPDHVYLVTVRHIPRVRLPLEHPVRP
ncbi:hypothetical protein AB0J14_37640 [Micromonospora arborensis]|uniref:hypothetical protein n=1 Tax=Micromonospora TaxID=1873 RepID=UPI0033E90294